MGRTTEEAFAHTKEVAKVAGLTFLSKTWINARTYYRFRCANAHEFERKAYVLTRGSTRCAECEKAAFQQQFLDRLARRNLICLEGKYLGGKVRHHFECEQGHRWDVEARKVLEGSGCPRCANERTAELNRHADGLDQLQKAAAAFGGRCLTDVYSGVAFRYEWECADGHRWRAYGYNVIKGGWCRRCFARRHSEHMRDPMGWERLNAVVTSHGGRCFDDRYDGSNEKYRFRCVEGHEWRATASAVMGGTWCPRCANRKTAEALRLEDGLAQLKEAAAAHGGEVRELIYMGLNARYTFRCARGHEWKTKGGHVLNDGSWCRQCAGLRRRHTIETMQQIARDRGGRCLSPAYLGVKIHLTWECHRGHVWEASPDSILNNESWCPNCAILEKTKKPRLRLRYDYGGKA
ncbi:hypothetical protein [Burkholderia territorii]|uniref:hypothetical protein n=1 Tax=Burkholderia territorii TaxID=1503055 RepID=UPI0009BE9206|nr:hypothetical protein [Burkholderia territorii]